MEPCRQRCPAGQYVYRYGPGRLGAERASAVQLCAAYSGRRINVGAAEDKRHAIDGRTISTDQPDDAVVDADHVRVLHIPVPGGTGRIHPVLQLDWSRNYCRNFRTGGPSGHTVRHISGHSGGGCRSRRFGGRR